MPDTQQEATAAPGAGDDSIDLANLPPGGQPGEVPVNKAQLAEALGWSLPTVDAKIRRGLPVAAEGKNGRAYAFYLSQASAWLKAEEKKEAELLERQREQVAAMQTEMNLQGGEASGAHAIADLGLRERLLDIGKKERLENEARGELCRAADVRQTLRELLGFVSDRLQSLPDYLERSAGLPPDAAGQISALVDEWHNELHRMALERFRPPEDETPAAAE